MSGTEPATAAAQGKCIVRVVFRGDVFRKGTRRASTGSAWDTGASELRACVESVREMVMHHSTREYQVVATYPRQMPASGTEAMSNIMGETFGRNVV
eukprot:2859691-Alexandrium_andersonii.AAC.1